MFGGWGAREGLRSGSGRSVGSAGAFAVRTLNDGDGVDLEGIGEQIGFAADELGEQGEVVGTDGVVALGSVLQALEALPAELLCDTIQPLDDSVGEVGEAVCGSAEKE